MKKKVSKISANEINRYTYCPYQWYYGKIYGQKVLKEKYQALHQTAHDQEGHFKKGLRFHAKYYKAYRRKRFLQLLAALAVLVMLLGGVIQCSH